MGKLDHLFARDLLQAIQEEREAHAFRNRPRGWVPVWTHVSAVADVVYPYDPAVWRAIREFDPNMIPLFVRRAYKAPTGEVRVFGYHACSSHRWSPGAPPAPWTHSVLRPTWCNMPAPTHMDLHLEDRRTRKGDGLPGKFIPYDWRVYACLRESYQEWSDKEKARFIETKGPAAVAQKAREKAEQDKDQRVARDGTRIMRHIARFDREDAIRLLTAADREARANGVLEEIGR